MDTNTKKKSLISKIFQPFFAGVLILFPLAITIIVIVWFVNLIADLLGPESIFGSLLQELGLNLVSNPITAYLIGLCAAIGLIFFLGLIVQARLKQRYNAISDSIMSRIPFIKTIYDASRKIANLFEVKDQPDMKAMSPVLCHFGGEGGTAVLALLTSKDVLEIDGMKYYSIMIPTSPVPIGGAILYVPVEWVKKVDMGIDGLINVYVSMGVTGPEYLSSKAK
jgi:uncharacterized membrane protein